jgi:8-oxo-dGTP pyrophosphatase MutT (NUDIX family)
MMSQLRRINILEQLRRLFGGNPPRVQAAALPWRRKDGAIEVLLVTSRGTGRWVLPKGWPEGRESLDQTAGREALEEAGVEGAIAGTELGRYYYDKDTPTGLSWRCEVAVYPLEVKREVKRWPEKKQRTRRWLPPQEAAGMVSEPDLAELIAAFDGNSRKIAA